MFKSAPRRWLLTFLFAALSSAAAWTVRAATDPSSAPTTPPAATPAPADAPNAGAAYTAAIKVTGPTTQFHDSVASRYNYAFGKDSPFLPSNATTSTGQFVSP